MISEPEELSGFRTTDGKIFANRQAAVMHQADISLRELCPSGDPPWGSSEDTLLEWLESNWETLHHLLFLKRHGYPPE